MSGFFDDGHEPDDLTDLLTRQEEPGTEDFLQKLRRRIHRRSVTSQLATFTLELPQPVLVELVHLAKEVFIAVAPRKENRP